jgi:beta-phosphoglucomutase
MTRALLFDMDGVLVDTERIHQQARREIYRRYGMDARRLEDIPVIGRNTDEIFVDVHARVPFPVPLAQAIREKRDVFVSLLREPIPPLPGVKDVLTKYRGKLKIGLCSSSARQNVEAVMKNTGLYVYFDGLVCAEDVRFYKPDPESYLLMARKLDADPGACVAFEDSRIGVLSAKNAGTRVIGVQSGHYADSLSLADLVVRDMASGLAEIKRFIGD